MRTVFRWLFLIGVGIVVTIGVSWYRAYHYPWLLRLEDTSRFWRIVDDQDHCWWVVAINTRGSVDDVRVYAPYQVDSPKQVETYFTETQFAETTRRRWWSDDVVEILDRRRPVVLRRDAPSDVREMLPLYAATAHGWPRPAMGLASGGYDAVRIGKPYTIGGGQMARRMIPLRPVWPGFAINTVLAACGLAMIRGMGRASVRWYRRRCGRCSNCGYNIRGSVGICSECGTPLRDRRCTPKRYFSHEKLMRAIGRNIVRCIIAVILALIVVLATAWTPAVMDGDAANPAPLVRDDSLHWLPPHLDWPDAINIGQRADTTMRTSTLVRGTKPNTMEIFAQSTEQYGWPWRALYSETAFVLDDATLNPPTRTTSGDLPVLVFGHEFTLPTRPLWSGVVLNTALATAGILLVWFALLGSRWLVRRRRRRCVQCGYDLRGQPADRRTCPECGAGA